MTEPEPGYKRFAGRHAAEESELDPGCCRCGFGLDAWVHTTSDRYVETPLTPAIWRALRGG